MKFIALLLLFSTSILAQDKEDDEMTVETKTSAPENPYAFLDSLNYSRKAKYNVAFILPISANKISVGDGKEQGSSMPQETREALGYWEGVNIAFAKIKKMNAKFNFHIWDNGKSDTLTEGILKEMKSMKFDAIVAPFHTKQALQVSEYSKKNRIPMFLSQNPSDVPAKDNPYAFKFHVPKNRLFYEYYLKIVGDITNYNTDVFFVYDGLNKNERKVSNYLKFMSDKDGTKRMKFIEYSSDLNLKNYIDTTRRSLFMISYSNTATIVEILDKLSAIQTGSLSVFGTNFWSNNNKLKLETLDKLNARIYTDFYYGNNKPMLNEVKIKYAEWTKDNTVSDVFLGYDVAMYIAETLNQYGVKFPLSIDKYKYNGVVTNVNMKPNYDGNGKILFFENASKSLLKATKDGWILEE